MSFDQFSFLNKHLSYNSIKFESLRIADNIYKLIII